MNGIINVLKPNNMTSFDVVAYLRKVIGVKKIGHTGTLDPMACGVLPVCIGKATGVVDYILNSNKTYVSEITFGIDTKTQDKFGEVLKIYNNTATKEEIKRAIHSFEGFYMQTPPMYSAIKINGKKLCDLARKGQEVYREPRKVGIKNIEVVNIQENKKAIFRCEVTKGTYIRTLCYDIGQKLGVGANMSFLVRTKVGNFDIKDSMTLEEITKQKKMGEISKCIVSTDYVLDCYPKVTIAKSDEYKFLNGNFIEYSNISGLDNGLVRVYNIRGDFLALGDIIKRQGVMFIKPKKMFV